MGKLAIEVISDVVCPWCYIGTTHLVEAVRELGVDAELGLEPFLLAPSVPTGGADLRDWLSQRYGDPEPMFRRVEAVGRASGLAIDFTKIRRHASTLRAHTLLRHARGRGTQWALGRALFQAYFEEGRDIGAMDVLIALATQHGFEERDVIRLCETPADLERTREAAQHKGVTGVPFTRIARQDASPGTPSVTVSGAQPVAVFRSAIERALADA